MQDDVSTVVMWSKSIPEVESQYGGRLEEFNGMSSQSHVPHCRVLPHGEFNVMIQEPRATFHTHIWHIWYSAEGTGRGRSPPSPLLL